MKVGHDRPVDAVAARVISRGESFEYRPMETEVCSSLPLPLAEDQPDDEPLKGIKFGRLTVIGRWQVARRRWVCRCVCGNYVLRKGATIKQAANDAACPQCYLMAVSKRKEFHARTGIHRETKEFLA